MRKDVSLDNLARRMNVAQFVSFSPSCGRPLQEFSRLRGQAPNARFDGPRSALAALLDRSADASANLRSFFAHDPQGHEFVYGLRSLDALEANLSRLIGQGLHVIANETVDVRDGGVSGVVVGNVAEFTPDDTPRGVDKAGGVALRLDHAIQVLGTAYRFEPALEMAGAARLEFSIHPRPRGWLSEHLIGWEFSDVAAPLRAPRCAWPNNFSRMLGDKVFGLLVAHAIGLAVPTTMVVGRRIAPFTFGLATGSVEVWTRTSPPEPVPGRFTTVKGWVDPFRLLAEEDVSGTALSSVLAQAAVVARYSGAAHTRADGTIAIEGVAGEGDAFMLGVERPQLLPSAVVDHVRASMADASEVLGPVRMEWAFDGERVWTLQLHQGASHGDADVLVEGEAREWLRFDPALGLPALREAIAAMPGEAGLLLTARVGVTGHVADVVRAAGRPARFAREP